MSLISSIKTRTGRRMEQKRDAKLKANIAGMRAAVSGVADIRHVSDGQLVDATLEAMRRQRSGEEPGPVAAIILRVLGVTRPLPRDASEPGNPGA